MNYRAILFDFHGVLCRDHFYTRTLFPEYKYILDWVEVNIFGNKELLEQWMRGKVSSMEINKMIAEASNVAPTFLHEKFLESVRLMGIDKNILRLVKKLRKNKVKLGLVTDNMDIFSDITIGNHQLNKIFHVIINSSECGLLKRDNGGELFDIALGRLDVDIKESLLIDDSPTAINLYKNKGGEVFLYRQFEELESYLF